MLWLLNSNVALTRVLKKEGDLEVAKLLKRGETGEDGTKLKASSKAQLFSKISLP